VNINKATLSKALTDLGAGEQAVGNAISRFDQCTSDAERTALYTELTKKAGTKKGGQDKAAPVADEAAEGDPEQPAKGVVKTK